MKPGSIIDSDQSKSPTETSVSDHDLVTASEFARLIAGFTNTPKDQVWERLEEEFAHPGSTVAKDWERLAPSTPEEITRFYQETDSYIYDLSADHSRVRRRPVEEAIHQRIAEHGQRLKVLVYGDGIGTDSLKISRNGHAVTYFDLPGKSSSFARYRFEQEVPKSTHSAPVAVFNKDEIPSGAFDVVVCVEVLEHVPDPPGVMRELARALKPGGIALITESFASIGPEFPSHLPENFKYAGKTHRMMEELGFANTYYNKDPLNYPMEFTKVAPGISGSLLVLLNRLKRATDTRLRRWRS